MKKTYYDIDEVGKVFLWCILAPQFLGFFAQIILMLIGSWTGLTVENLLDITPVYISYIMLAQIAFLIVFLYFSKKINVKKAVKFNYKNFGIINTIICVLIGIIGIFGLTPISGLFDELLKLVNYTLSEGFLFDLNSPLMLIVAIILIAGVPAIVEELVFRGIIFQGLRKFGNLVAILATSGLFVLIHLSAQQIIYPFLFSIILCYVVLKTNSILSSMIIHFVANAVSILCTYYSLNIIIDLPIWASILIAIGIAGLTFLIVWLLTKLMKNTEKEKSAEEILENLEFTEQLPAYNSSTKYLKYGIVLAVVLYVLTFAFSYVSV